MVAIFKSECAVAAHSRPTLDRVQYRCPLPERLVAVAAAFSEFANGGAQATAVLLDGRVVPGVLISNGMAVIAARGYSEPPFEPSQVAELYQTEEDLNPKRRDGWQFWDEWK